MQLLNTAIADESNGFVNPQVEHMGDYYDWDAPESVTNLGLPAGEDRVPNLRSFHLDPATRFTDVVTQGYIPTPGLLVSTRLQTLLSGFAIQAHRCWEADVVLGNEHRAYRWLAFTGSMEVRVDWKASRFEIRRDGGVIEPVDFGSAASMTETAGHLVDTLSGQLRARRISFLEQERAPDLFVLPLSSRSFFVSEPLAARLREQSMTGFRLEPLPL